MDECVYMKQPVQVEAESYGMDIVKEELNSSGTSDGGSAIKMEPEVELTVPDESETVLETRYGNSMNGSAGKKKRSPNFSDQERKLFLTIFRRYKDILQNKKSDAMTKDEKNVAWSQLAEDYNSATTMYYRSVDNLRSLWDNMKRAAKKAKADEKQDISTTGFSRDKFGPSKEDEEVLEILGPSGLSDSYSNDYSWPVYYAEKTMGAKEAMLAERPAVAEDDSEQSNGDDVAKSWKAGNTVKLLPTPRTPQVRCEVKAPSTSFDDTRTDLTKEDLAVDRKRKEELHNLTVKKLKLEILQLKKDLGVLDGKAIREICESENL